MKQPRVDKDASVFEVNFDCLVGPTHHFGGLSFGNLASTNNKARLSSPKKAALQGLKKMHFLQKRGFIQGVLPPHERPHISGFRNLGFYGSDDIVLKNAYKSSPHIFSSLCSSSSMWAANAATVSPRTDSADGLVHISPANLITMFHRSIEHEFAHRVFSLIFNDPRYFCVHHALLSHDLFSDEGAANHNRLCPGHNHKGLQIFVYGKESALASQKSVIFPSRQSKLANIALARKHKLDDQFFLNIPQNPLAIDKGAFHNDVVCVVNENVMLCHEFAFLGQKAVLTHVRDRYHQLFGQPPIIIEIKNHELPIEDAVNSYLFNSQLLTKPHSRSMLLFAPLECQNLPTAYKVTKQLLSADNPIDEVEFFDISESMANGGGPACLRIRIPLSEAALSATKRTVLLSDQLFIALTEIINQYYVDELTIDHFFDKEFLDQAKTALSAIADILGLGTIYDFQR
jgi:succinylarginine dihydrolase